MNMELTGNCPNLTDEDRCFTLLHSEMQKLDSLTILHSGRQKLYTILVFLNAIGLKESQWQC